MGDFSAETLKKMFSDVEGDPGMMDMMQTVMERFMSKEVLHEGLTELKGKFQEWLERKHSSLTPEEREKYELQLSSIEQVLHLYENNESAEDPSGAAQMQDLLKQMETVGTLPEELLQELGKEGGDMPCTIM